MIICYRVTEYGKKPLLLKYFKKKIKTPIKLFGLFIDRIISYIAATLN